MIKDAREVRVLGKGTSAPLGSARERKLWWPSALDLGKFGRSGPGSLRWVGDPAMNRK